MRACAPHERAAPALPARCMRRGLAPCGLALWPHAWPSCPLLPPRPGLQGTYLLGRPAGIGVNLALVCGAVALQHALQERRVWPGGPLRGTLVPPRHLFIVVHLLRLSARQHVQPTWRSSMYTTYERQNLHPFTAAAPAEPYCASGLAGRGVGRGPCCAASAPKVGMLGLAQLAASSVRCAAHVATLRCFLHACAWACAWALALAPDEVRARPHPPGGPGGDIGGRGPEHQGAGGLGCHWVGPGQPGWAWVATAPAAVDPGQMAPPAPPRSSCACATTTRMPACLVESHQSLCRARPGPPSHARVRASPSC